MSFSTFYLIQLSNEYYIEHILRSPPPATERMQILPYHHQSVSPCEHNLPTPCPPSTPILVQLTNSGRNLDVHLRKGPEDTLIQTLHSDLSKKTAIAILNELNDSPAIESVSPNYGSRNDHLFYICRLCCPIITHVLNIGTMLHHITQDHTTNCYNHRDKLTKEASGHLAEIRHLLKQTNDRWVFSIIRSSSDSLPKTTWRGNNASSGIKSLIMDINYDTNVMDWQTPTFGEANRFRKGSIK